VGVVVFVVTCAIGFVRISANFSCAKVRRFVHVNPEAIKGQQLVKFAQLFFPVLLDRWIQEVRVMRGSWPDLQEDLGLGFKISGPWSQDF
jgi:hypothetical protein